MKNNLVSVVIPCLNEELSIGLCISNAKIGLSKIRKLGLKGEIIVVDNGSSDKSADIARKAKVRVIKEPVRGYGRAYKTGIARALGKYIVIGDADNTYDFKTLADLIKPLDSGSDLVLGSRFLGKFKSGSMPFFNRILGNPILTFMINIFYGCKLSDTQTGYRAFTKTGYNGLHLTSDGMEFASEMIIKAISNRLKISQVPVSYAPRIGKSKLSPISDAWRHVQAIMIYSPTYSIIFPGLILTLTGLFGTLILLPGPIYLGKATIDIHTMIMSTFLMIMGTNILLIGFFARLYTVQILNVKGGLLTNLIIKHITINKLLFSGIILVIIAFIIIFGVVLIWISSGFSALAQERELVTALGLAVIGTQFIYSSFLFGLLRRQ